MNFKQIEKFVSLFGEKPEKTESGWAIVSCVFAPYLHQSGVDNNPSMGIKVVPGGDSYYSCFSCMQKGSLVSLVQDLRDKAGSGEYPYSEMLVQIANAVDDALVTPTFDDESKKKWELDPYDEEWLSNFLPLYTHPYLKKRGIPPSVAKELDIRFSHKFIRIGFPIRNFSGKLCGFQGRDVTDKQRKKYLFFKPYEKKYNHRVWLGEDKVDLDKTVILTEGAFDYARIYQVYPNVMASLGANINSTKLDRLKFGGGQFVTFYDNDMAGDIARDILSHAFKKRILKHVIPSTKQDAGFMSKKELRNHLTKFKNTFILN